MTAMAVNVYVVFDPVQEAADGKGWKVTSWDDTVEASVLSPTIEYFYKLANPAANKATVTNKALTTNVATLTTQANHGFVTGMVVEVTGVGTPFDGTYTVASTPTGTTFTYARTATNVGSTAATGFAAVPVTASLTATVSNKALTTNVATITTAAPHGFKAGQYVTVAIDDTIFNGTFVISSVTSTTILYALTAANVGSAAATGTVVTTQSALERIDELMSDDPAIIEYFQGTAEATVLAANAATVNATRDASLVAEGLVP